MSPIRPHRETGLHMPSARRRKFSQTSVRLGGILLLRDFQILTKENMLILKLIKLERFTRMCFQMSVQTYFFLTCNEREHVPCPSHIALQEREVQNKTQPNE